MPSKNVLKTWRICWYWGQIPNSKLQNGISIKMAAILDQFFSNPSDLPERTSIFWWWTSRSGSQTKSNQARTYVKRLDYFEQKLISCLVIHRISGRTVFRLLQCFSTNGIRTAICLVTHLWRHWFPIRKGVWKNKIAIAGQNGFFWHCIFPRFFASDFMSTKTTNRRQNQIQIVNYYSWNT